MSCQLTVYCVVLCCFILLGLLTVISVIHSLLFLGPAKTVAVFTDPQLRGSAELLRQGFMGMEWVWEVKSNSNPDDSPGKRAANTKIANSVQMGEVRQQPQVS